MVLLQPVMAGLPDHVPGLLTDQQVEGGQQHHHAQHDREDTHGEDETA